MSALLQPITETLRVAGVVCRNAHSLHSNTMPIQQRCAVYCLAQPILLNPMHMTVIVPV